MYRSHVLVCGGTGCTSSGSGRIVTAFERELEAAGLDKEIKVIKGEVVSPVDPKPGCRFAARCEHCQERCHQEAPALKEVSPGHFVACHLCDN